MQPPSQRRSEALDRMVEQVAQTLAAMEPRLREVQRVSRETYARVARDVLPLLGALAEAARRGMPPNWRGLTGEEIEATIALSTESGISVVWAPEMSIIRELNEAADNSARSAVRAR